MIFEILFWLSLCVMIYVYFGFIIILYVISKVQNNPVKKKDFSPSISVIISAYNEENNIEKTIKNCLELDYPKELLEIIVVSDGSNDKTNAILEKMTNLLLKIYIMPDRNGKTFCHNFAVRNSRNEVLFFTDATTLHPPNFLKLLLRNLNDPSVGCATGRPVFKASQSLTYRGLTKREAYEVYLRTLLGESFTVFGADPSYVIPRRLYVPLREDLSSGFAECLKLVEKGYRIVYEPKAIAIVDRPSPKIEDEFIRRSRIVLRGMRALIHMRQLLNPFKYGFKAIALISTRLLRWLSPVYLLTLFVSNTFLLDSTFYVYTFMLQILFYITAFAGYLLERIGYKVGLAFHIPLYFCILAGSCLLGLKKLILGETGQTWETRNRFKGFIK